MAPPCSPISLPQDGRGTKLSCIVVAVGRKPSFGNPLLASEALAVPGHLKSPNPSRLDLLFLELWQFMILVPHHLIFTNLAPLAVVGSSLLCSDSGYPLSAFHLREEQYTG